jgi:hypothetical protein
MCKKGSMSASLLQEDRSAKRAPQTPKQSLNVDVPDAWLILGLSIYNLSAEWMPVGQLLYGLERTAVSALSLCAFCVAGLRILFARWSGVGGVGLAMALNRIFTSSPIQLYKISGILRANRAPALVLEQFAVISGRALDRG